jgi:amidase
VTEECKNALEHAASLLDGLGHDVFEGSPDWGEPSELLSAFLTVWNTGSAYWDIRDWEKLEQVNAAMREISRGVDSITYLESLLRLQHLCRQVVSSWGRDFDVLITPTLATEPPEIGALYAGVESDPLAPLNNAAAIAPFTPIFNSTGQPAISLPLYWAPSGLPIGIQLVGKPWGEAELLRLAGQIEQAAPWADKRPALS